MGGICAQGTKAEKKFQELLCYLNGINLACSNNHLTYYLDFLHLYPNKKTSVRGK